MRFSCGKPGDYWQRHAVPFLSGSCRCVPEIIQFSSALSYDNAIRPLREPMFASVRPFVVSHRVNGFRGENDKTNEIEAEEIASLVIACINDSSYQFTKDGPTELERP